MSHSSKSSADASTPEFNGSAFVMTGVADDHRGRWIIGEGTTTVGSGDDNAITLSIRGVSRQHARLVVVDGRLTVEDRDSKNGTFVNSTRVHNAELRPGDHLSLGPVLFTVGEADPDDARIGITIDRSTPIAAPHPEEETETRVAHNTPEPMQWLPAALALARRMPADRAALVSAALGDLCSALRCEGAALVSWRRSGGESIVVASHGILPAPSDLGTGRTAASECTRVVTKRLSESCVAAVAGAPDGSGAGLWLLGDVWGAADPRPLSELLLRTLMASGSGLVDRGRSDPGELIPELRFPRGHVVGRSQAMATVYQQLQLVLKGTLPILVVGPTGSGKEHVARILHASSDRGGGPFVAVNCAAVPRDLLEAELFGIEKGVATDVSARLGTLERASGGIVLLDEIGDMSPELQAKLLRALQEGEVHPVGARAPRAVDVRIVSATNVDLEHRIADGRFRSDLYYRLAGLTLRVPALAERRDDIPLLVEHILTDQCEAIGKFIAGISVKALRSLTEAPWPGNVRQLENEVRRLVHLCGPRQAIDSSLISPELLSSSNGIDPDRELDLGQNIERLERRLIATALERTHGNRTRAAEQLGVSRAGLLMKIRRLGLE